MGWCHTWNVNDSSRRLMAHTTRYMHVLQRSTAVSQRPRAGRAKAPAHGQRHHGHVLRTTTSVCPLTSQTATRTALIVPSASRAVHLSHVVRQPADTARRLPCSRHTRQPATVKGTLCAAISAAAAVTPRTSAGVPMTCVSRAAPLATLRVTAAPLTTMGLSPQPQVARAAPARHSRWTGPEKTRQARL